MGGWKIRDTPMGFGIGVGAKFEFRHPERHGQSYLELFLATWVRVFPIFSL